MRKKIILTIALPTYNREDKISNLFDFIYNEYNQLSKVKYKVYHPIQS